MLSTYEIPINNLKSGWISKSPEVGAAIQRVIQSGHFVHGIEHKTFEEELASYLDVNYVMGVASGSDALQLALKAVGCEVGSKIVSVANAGGYTSIAATSIGCEVVYCDVEPSKLLIDKFELKKVLTSEIKAVVVTHLYGNIAQISPIKNLCEELGIAVIEDCAQALGGIENGKKVGTIGDIGAFSFYPTKNLGAMGDGGALATNNPAIAERIIQLRQYGWTSKYVIDLPGGMNSRLDEIQAAVLRLGLRKLDDMNNRRLAIIEKYAEATRESSLRLVTSHIPGNVAHLAVLEVSEVSFRDKFRKHMAAHGIQTDIHYPVLDFNQKGLIFSSSPPDLKNSKSASMRIVTIPLYPELSKNEQARILSAVQNFV